jgi:hypothetical protein
MPVDRLDFYKASQAVVEPTTGPRRTSDARKGPPRGPPSPQSAFKEDSLGG